jgi:hypothetical protein
MLNSITWKRFSDANSPLIRLQLDLHNNLIFTTTSSSLRNFASSHHSFALELFYDPAPDHDILLLTHLALYLSALSHSNGSFHFHHLTTTVYLKSSIFNPSSYPHLRPFSSHPQTSPLTHFLPITNIANKNRTQPSPSTAIRKMPRAATGKGVSWTPDTHEAVSILFQANLPKSY